MKDCYIELVYLSEMHIKMLILTIILFFFLGKLATANRFLHNSLSSDVSFKFIDLMKDKIIRQHHLYY